METKLYCPSCGKVEDTFLQRDYRVKDREAHLLFGTCDTEGCTLYHQTLSVGSLAGDLSKYGLPEVRYDFLTGEKV